MQVAAQPMHRVVLQVDDGGEENELMPYLPLAVVSRSVCILVNP